jgi:hypothetical protein
MGIFCPLYRPILREKNGTIARGLETP